MGCVSPALARNLHRALRQLSACHHTTRIKGRGNGEGKFQAKRASKVERI